MSLLTDKKKSLTDEFNKIRKETISMEEHLVFNKTRMVQLQGAFKALDEMEKEETLAKEPDSVTVKEK